MKTTTHVMTMSVNVKKMHDHEIDIDISVVKKLVNEQFPQWAHLPIQRFQSAGTDNAIYLLGTDMGIRLPRVQGIDEQIKKSFKWLTQFESVLPLAIPIPLAQGNPDESYPWHWSIYRWLKGKNAYIQPIMNLNKAAIDLANFLTVLQSIKPAEGIFSRRGVPLTTQDIKTRKAIELLEGTVDTNLLTIEWEKCVQAENWNKSPVWIHGDLLPTNVLIEQGYITGIIDFDSLGTGDPACDLLPAWSLLDSKSRNVFRTKLEIDDATWVRGRGWALSIALIILPYYQKSNPTLVAIAKRILHEILNCDS